MKNTIWLAVLLSLPLAACLENEEEVVVHPDGSVAVTVRAHGALGDLAAGYPVPLEAPWTPVSDDAKKWIRQVGTATGGEGVRARARRAWPKRPDQKEVGLDLVVARDFPSAEALPSWFAPESDPYRTATMERSATLEVEQEGERTIYVFERTYHGIDYRRLDPGKRADDAFGEEIYPKLKQENPFSEEEWQHLRDSVAWIHMDVAELFVRDAVLGLYTQGDASLAPQALVEVIATVREAVDALLPLETFFELHGMIRDDEDERASDFLEAFERDYRDTIRATLARALAQAELDDRIINAVLFALEWGFASFDHYGDIGDEDFHLSVRMPGVLVGGNFHESEGNTAKWHHEGTVLHSGDLVMRAISVLE